ncbi:MAG TPA: hypothetical protein VGH98_10620 [Gemmatimonadaceae bacterium]|jgi:hypothetical protein
MYAIVLLQSRSRDFEIGIQEFKRGIATVDVQKVVQRIENVLTECLARSAILQVLYKSRTQPSPTGIFQIVDSGAASESFRFLLSIS